MVGGAAGAEVVGMARMMAAGSEYKLKDKSLRWRGRRAFLDHDYTLLLIDFGPPALQLIQGRINFPCDGPGMEADMALAIQMGGG